MLLLAVMAALCICAVVLSSILGFVGGTAVDLNAIIGAAAVVLGALALGGYAVASNGDEQDF